MSFFVHVLFFPNLQKPSQFSYELFTLLGSRTFLNFYNNLYKRKITAYYLRLMKITVMMRKVRVVQMHVAAVIIIMVNIVLKHFMLFVRVRVLIFIVHHELLVVTHVFREILRGGVRRRTVEIGS